ncbi:hypothetical protein QTP70_011428 [Hemibagrus guttatus]|uniref:ribonuclease H n=1 Tax=Hemibagrus guttatus TaxID=175788 RepID=A0AAE0RD46_9TELE|nr:hypothetical protein QTP70_011428 [Hemibagrus guttatus]
MDIMAAFVSCETNRGRLNSPLSCSNGENRILPEFEALHEATPRAPMPSGSANLIVMNIKMYEKTNKRLHHTDAYHHSNLIIRRGQEFTMGIVFNRPFNPKMDLFFIEFLIGKNPIRTQNTLISLTLGENNETSDWEFHVVETSKNETKLAITPAADCIVGLYSTYVTVITNLGRKRSQRNKNTDFYVLFNPWEPKDQVYLENEDERKEYVLNNVGIIYNGDYTNINKRPWNYGQARSYTFPFQSGVLEACIFILDFGKMPVLYRGDAVKVVRKASSMINSLDDDGVLVGTWGGDFSLGTAPTAWTGSVEILTKYFSEGGKPVMYGQCWVYAGVFNTFLRCLGLPARVVTNFCSAHDNNGNLKTDIVLDEDGSLDRQVSDTIWNFHCWNEVYLQRHDIPQNYSGWQVVDATPQEISEGYYRCGPTAVAAVKNEALGYSYDARFVFAEVNSVVVYHKKDKYGNMNVIYVDSNYVGKLIVTKMIGSNDYNDITDSYKHTKTSALDNYQPTLPDTDVKLCTQATANNDGLMLTLIFNNLSNEPRTITAKITGKVEFYTGATRTQFTLLTHEVSLKPLEYKQEVITVKADKYKNFIIGQSFLSFIVYAFVNETSMSLTSMESIYMKAPPLLLEVSKISQVGNEMFAIVGFTNTLGYDLTDVTVRMEGLNLFPVKTKTYSIIEQGSKIKWIESFKTQKADRSRPGLTTTAIGAVDLQGAGGNWATVGRRSRGGRRVRRQREKRKGKGRELADVMERKKVDILCVQETRWKGSKARSIGAGFKLFYYGVDSKRNGVGVVVKEEFMRNVLEVGCELEEKERFWSELDKVMESIPTGERVVIGADFNGHVGEGNTGDEEVMGKFGVKERNLEGQMVVDFAKRMDMGVVNTYFQKREEHRVTYKSGGRRTQKLRQALGGQVVLQDDWETTAEVIRETGRKDSIQRKRLAKKKWDMDRTEENRQEYKELQRRVKREVSKAKQKAYEELYTRLDTREGEKDLYRVLTSEESVQRRWKEYFEELMNEENEREKRVEGVNSVEQKVDKVRKDEVRKALKRMKESERMPEEWRRSVLVPIFKNKDLEKAYDRVPREELWYCMRKSGVAEKYVRVVQDMYEIRTVVRCAVGQTEEFNVEVGLHQGSALSPFLFAIVMDQLSEEVRQESPWTMMFADDIVICSESREQVEENLERWRFALERRGMKVSRSKTEYMCVNEREGSGTVRLQGEEVKKVQEFKYLGSTVQSNGECGKEVKKRVQAGWNGWRKVSGVLCDQKISARIKGKVYRTVVRPAMLYGLETVSLRKRQESELESITFYALGS